MNDQRGTHGPGGAHDRFSLQVFAALSYLGWRAPTNEEEVQAQEAWMEQNPCELPVELTHLPQIGMELEGPPWLQKRDGPELGI